MGHSKNHYRVLAASALALIIGCEAETKHSRERKAGRLVRAEEYLIGREIEVYCDAGEYVEKATNSEVAVVSSGQNGIHFKRSGAFCESFDVAAVFPGKSINCPITIRALKNGDIEFDFTFFKVVAEIMGCPHTRLSLKYALLAGKVQPVESQAALLNAAEKIQKLDQGMAEGLSISDPSVREYGETLFNYIAKRGFPEADRSRWLPNVGESKPFDWYANLLNDLRNSNVPARWQD